MGSCCGADLSDPEIENANSIEEIIEILKIKSNEFLKKRDSLSEYLTNDNIQLPPNISPYATKTEIEEIYNKSSNIYDEYKRAIDILEIFKSKLKKNTVIEEMNNLNKFAREDDYLSMKYLNNDLTNYCNKL
jgi:hypothetical protein